MSLAYHSYLFFAYKRAEIQKEQFQYLKTVKLKICRGRKNQLVVSCQVVTNPCCGLSVIFCGFISHLISRETINIPEIFSGVHGFTGKTVIVILSRPFFVLITSIFLFVKFSIFQGHPGKSILCKRPFYDLLPTIECHTPRTVHCRLAVNPGMQICGCTKHGS